MLDFVPDPIAIQIGPLPVYWYGIGYALGLAAAYLVLTRIGRRAGEDDELVGNGMIIIAVAALIGGRLYHVIDQWQLYKDDLTKIVLPPYSGLGVYGGIITGIVAAILYTRWKRAPFARWADIIAPALFTMQAVARWGNFFNQELYGPPTTLPWGIPIDCAHRIAAYPCADFPLETTAFHPLFLYESLSGAIGAIVLIWLGFHARRHLRVGDLILLFFIWYGAVRFTLEALRTDNWLFFGVPTAQVVSILFIVAAALILLWRHRPGHPLDDPPTHPEVATWGAIGRPVEPTEGPATDALDVDAVERADTHAIDEPGAGSSEPDVDAIEGADAHAIDEAGAGSSEPDIDGGGPDDGADGPDDPADGLDDAAREPPPTTGEPGALPT